MSSNILDIKISKVKSVFSEKKYLYTLVLSSAITFVVLYLLMVATNSFSLDVFIEMNGSFYTAVSIITSLLIAVLFGVYAAISLYRFDFIQKVGGGNTAASTGGFFTALFSAGCPTCGSLLLPLVGISSLAVFPFKGLELKAASILLLGIVNLNVMRSLDKCPTYKPKVKFAPVISAGADKFLYVGLFIVAIFAVFNQAQIVDISNSLDFKIMGMKIVASGSDGIDLSSVDVSEINSTAMAVGMLFPVSEIKSQDDAIVVMLSAGTPEYSADLGGISFDDPVNSMEYLAKWYPTLKEEIKQNDPETWNSYLSLAAAPKGISCEACCGLGPQSVDAKGDLMCGCKHAPALQAIALGLVKHTDYNDAEVLREVMRWKAMFFPKNMVETAMSIAGTDLSQLKDLPGMVGGC